MLKQSNENQSNNMVSFSPKQLNKEEQYKLLSGSVLPRPIALVTTLGENGPNAAPFSFFNVIGTNPPMFMLSVGKHKSGREKDTIANLKHCPELVIHIVDEDNAEKMNLCSEPLPAGVNEIEKVGFNTVPSIEVKPPRLIDLPIQFECVVESIQELGDVPYTMVIAKAVQMHFREGLVNSKYHMDLQALNPIARIVGPGMYIRISDQFQLPQMF